MLHGIFGIFNGWRMRLRHGFVLNFMIKWFHLLTPGFDSKVLINFTLHLKIKLKKQQQIRKKSNPLFYFWSVIVSSKKDKMHQNHHQCTRLFISNYKQMFLHPNLCIYIRDKNRTENQASLLHPPGHQVNLPQRKHNRILATSASCDFSTMRWRYIHVFVWINRN